MQVADPEDLRISFARIEGMLTVTLARHDQRLDQHESTLTQHGSRLNEKAKTLARHDERLKDLEEDNAALWGRSLGLVGVLISGIVALLTITGVI